MPEGPPHLRPAGLDDVAALAAIENDAFASDRLSPRSLRRLIRSGSADIIIADEAGAARGYAAILFRRGSAVARLYSIAVADAARGRGVGVALLQAAEDAARARGARTLRLEVRAGNSGAIALYRKHGFRNLGRIADYYADHAEALRFEKALVPPDPGAISA